MPAEEHGHPLVEIVEVVDTVLFEYSAQLRQMLAHQSFENLPVEGYSWKTFLVKRSHLVILDQRDKDPEGRHFVTWAVQEDTRG